MRVISFSNHKGGVGKTTSVVNIGAGLSKTRNVLLIDLDQQANLTISFGLEESEKNIYSYITGGEYEIINVKNNLDVLPSSSSLVSADNISLNSDKFIGLINNLRNKYDYILIDCPPSLGNMTMNAFISSDEIIVPIQPHFLAVKGISKILNVVNSIKLKYNDKLEISAVFLTMFDKRRVLHKNVLDIITAYFDDRVLNTKIRNNISLAEAPADKQDIFDYDSDSNGAKDYQNVVSEIINMENKWFER